MNETARPLLRELIDIPERVYQGDFVLRLADGVSDAQSAETVRNYVVTPQLDWAFDLALGFIQRAVQTRRSGACYLHGSFGAGKSHFMAVLDLLLAGNTLARSIPELAATVTRHDDWISGKRFLMVPFHMIGARDVESAILGGYAEYVRGTDARLLPRREPFRGRPHFETLDRRSCLLRPAEQRGRRR